MLFDVSLFPDVLQESYFAFQGADYLYFDDKVEFYSLYYRDRKIQSFQEFVYCMEVLIWLNKEIEWEKFLEMGLWVSDRSNGKTIRTYGERRVKEACEYVFSQVKKPYVNNYRRIVFNPTKKVTKEDRMRIVGIMCGGRKRKVDPQTIYDVVEELMSQGIRIRLKDVAKSLGVVPQTISNHVTEDIKEMIRDYNKTVL